MGRGQDSSTRIARAVRASLVRWFALLVALCLAALAPSLALVAAWQPPLAWAAYGGVSAVVIVVALVGLRRLLGHIERLDQERHGLRAAYDRARLDALRDALTGLGNHRAFQEELDEQVSVARAYGRSFALVLLDVDDLKKTNDARGHSAGDELLRAMARIIVSCLRRSDHGFRVGGDEFAMLLVDCEPAEVIQVARRVLAAALEGGIGTRATEPFSVTIGISTFPDLAHDRQQLVHQADAALYFGKRHGRTDVQVFDPARHGMAEDFRPLHELAAAVARVAGERLLTPVYQPIHSLRTGRVVGYEGLVRPREGAGFANAGALFVAAESTGHTVELDLASLDTVLAGAGALDETHYLSINVSPRSLEADAFSPLALIATVRRWGLDPSRIVVELTEREAVEDFDRLREALAVLKRHGMRIAADDVGAGNAGLRLLSELEFDIMKIDLTLVRAGARSEPSSAVLRALADLARRRGQMIVAEGVETADELDVVIGLEFDAAQGYLLRRPTPSLDAGGVDLAGLVGLPIELVRGGNAGLSASA